MASSSSSSSSGGSSVTSSFVTSDSFKISTPPSTPPQSTSPPPDQVAFSFPNQDHTKTLLVRSLGPDVCPKYIRDLFLPYGSIKSLRVLWEGDVDTIAAIEFEDQRSAEKAMLEIDKVTKKNTDDRYATTTTKNSEEGEENADDGRGDVNVKEHVTTKEVTRGEGKDKKENLTSVFVGATGNLTEEDLSEAFKPFGRIKNLLLVRDYKTGLSKRYAFVTYTDEASASDAIKAMNGATVKNTTIGVMWDHGGKTNVKNKSSSVEDSNTTIFVGATGGDHLTEKDLSEAFKAFGRIRKVFLKRDDITGVPLGFAFVTFADEGSAQRAINEMNGATVKNAIVRVEWDQGKRRKAKKNNMTSVGNVETLELGYPRESEKISKEASPGRKSQDTRDAYELERQNNECPSPGTKVEEPRVEKGEEMEMDRKSQKEFYYEKISQQSSPENTTIFCCYKQGVLTDQILRKKFSPFGKITGVKCYEDEGYGFVRFEERGSAIEAIIEKNGVKPKRGGIVMVGWGSW